jgi:hypothetical protein
VPAAAAAALAAWAVAGPLAGIDLDARRGGAVEPVDAGGVLAATLLAGALAWAALAAAERLLRPARAALIGSALVAIGLSLLDPLLAGADPAGAAAMVGTHLIVGAVLLYGLLGGSGRPPHGSGRPLHGSGRLPARAGCADATNG